MTGYAVNVDGTGWHRADGPDDIDPAIEYYMEDNGVEPPAPKPTPAMLMEMAQAEVAAYTRNATAQITALQGRIEAISDAVELGGETESEAAELPVRQSQLTEWKRYRVLLGRVSTAAGWPKNPSWPAAPATYSPGA